MSCCSYTQVPTGDASLSCCSGERESVGVHCFVSLYAAHPCLGKMPSQGRGLGQVGPLGCMGSQRGMGGRKCCVWGNSRCGGREEPNVAFCWSPVISSLFLIPYSRYDVPWKNVPSLQQGQSESTSYTCVWVGWKEPQKDVNKGRRKISAFTQSFPKLCGSFIRSFSTVDLMVSSYLTRDFMIHIG